MSLTKRKSAMNKESKVGKIIRQNMKTCICVVLLIESYENKVNYIFLSFFPAMKFSVVISYSNFPNAYVNLKIKTKPHLIIQMTPQFIIVSIL